MRFLYLFLLVPLSFSSNSQKWMENPLLGAALIGKASFYGRGFHGRLTANGEIMDKYAMTCASKDLPFNTMLEVRYPKKDTKVILRVNDRGPFIPGRIIDVSRGAAEALGMVNDGVVDIEVTVIGTNGHVYIQNTRPFSHFLEGVFENKVK
ncbi:MAG: rare lipoprotein A [Algoriphagus sp.]|jgi:rare lipoprotein A